MDFLSRLNNQLADARVDANLLTFYGVVVATVVVSLILRRLLLRGGGRLVRWSRLCGLDAIGEEAVRHLRRVIFWLTVGLVLLVSAAGLTYHYSGRDIRHDFGGWYERLSGEELLQVGLGAVALFLLAAGAWSGVWMVRRLQPLLQNYLNHWIGCPENKELLPRWFALLEWLGVAAVRMLAVWGAAVVVGLGSSVGIVVLFALRVLAIVVVARLLTIACRTLSKPIADLGDRYLSMGQVRLYWERLTRLFPFGERCFEAAVYVLAASLCVRELAFIAMVADFGPLVVECIGILFGTRVIIELLQVLLHQAFGLHDQNQNRTLAHTLVPLLQSICQYLLYFGSAVAMLGVFGISVLPFLAGAGILGLGVGLGAQHLVQDVVSGFFILFENQYLVGDYVQIGDAAGTVEAVGIRLTQIRDGHGKLHLIPNGQVKSVVSYSKGYVNAVVDVKTPTGSDLESVFRNMTEAGKRLKQAHKEVLADTVVQGIVDLGTTEMTVRAVTKVQPGAHGAMQSEYRRLLKLVLDQVKAAGQAAKAA